jgi:hypothetical protein
MKHCPSCATNYADPHLGFCSKDGSLLANGALPAESDTLRIGAGYDTGPLNATRSEIDLEVTVQPMAGERSVFHANEWAGTKRQSRPLEGFGLRLLPSFDDLSIRYNGHFQEAGDVDSVGEGHFLGGDFKEPRRLEGFSIELTGRAADQFDIIYKAHLADWEDTRVFKNGEFCGTKKKSRSVEGIMVWISPRESRVTLKKS